MGGSIVGLSFWPVGSDTVSGSVVSELSYIGRCPTGNMENGLVWGSIRSDLCEGGILWDEWGDTQTRKTPGYKTEFFQQRFVLNEGSINMEWMGWKELLNPFMIFLCSEGSSTCILFILKINTSDKMWIFNIVFYFNFTSSRKEMTAFSKWRINF